MVFEKCLQCRFDGGEWTDTEAVEAVATLPSRWRDAVSGLSSDEFTGRPIPDMWSIAEYVDHVREVLFGMRFVLDTAVAESGKDLGEPPEPRFDPEPLVIDVEEALSGIDREANALRHRLEELPDSSWDSTAIVGGNEIDAHWIARHAVHDATHHLLDVDHLREAI